MSNKCVTVLAPNGRRQNVKVTPNTTILQVLEEVCNKQGFKAEEYDITHHNKVVDASAIMRYTGLPNNAQLEMASAVKTRAETRVKIGLALESGDRVLGEFEPSDSLWNVVKSLCPDEAEADESADIHPVIFYMGREESGTENLKKTTLRSLGLTKGGAILRFFKKTPEELHRQANVSGPLPRPAKQMPVQPSTSGCVTKIASQMVHTVSPVQLSTSSTDDTSTVVQSVTNEETTIEINPRQAAPLQTDPPQTATNHKGTQPDATQTDLRLLKSGSESMDMEYEDSTGTSQISSSESALEGGSVDTVDLKPEVYPEETIVFLGERNAVLFDKLTAKACKPEDVPDDFFDLTIDDAKQLLRDLKRRQASLEEKPLMTAQYRELEKSKQVLNTLHNYKRCVIRVQFPNQLVLQGTFTPLEKISHVMEFVQKYLEESVVDFHLFMTPPKRTLQPKQTLVETKCVPGAVLHFMSSTPCPEHGSYIKQEIMHQVSSANAAAAAACKSRGLIPTRLSSSCSLSAQNEASTSPGVPTCSRDTAPKPQQFSTNIPHSSNTEKTGPTDKKVPKWFKPVPK